MRFEELRREIIEAMKNKPHFIRDGQFVFNYIDEKYGVARDIQFQDNIDCFHDDSQINTFIAKATQRIGQHE
jgi:hypothetical protein